MPKEVLEIVEKASSKVRREVGETRGGVELCVDVAKANADEMKAIEWILREERRPFVVIKGWNPKKAVQLCKVQDVMGEHYIWEVPRNKNSRAVNAVMTSIGGEGILMGKSKVWTNSPEVRKAIEEEEAKRDWWRSYKRGRKK